MSAWSPSYKIPFAICACMSTLAIMMCFLFRAHLVFLNKLAEGAYSGSDIKGQVGLVLADAFNIEMHN